MSDLQPAIRDHLIRSRDGAERFSPVLLSIRAGTFLVSLFACVFELIIANFRSGFRVEDHQKACS